MHCLTPEHHVLRDFALMCGVDGTPDDLVIWGLRQSDMAQDLACAARGSTPLSGAGYAHVYARHCKDVASRVRTRQGDWPPMRSFMGYHGLKWSTSTSAGTHARGSTSWSWAGRSPKSHPLEKDLKGLTLRSDDETMVREQPTNPQEKRRMDNSLIGQNVIVETLGRNYTGKLVQVTPTDLVLEDAAWIADSRRWADFLQQGSKLAGVEIEPYPDGAPVVVNRSVVVAYSLFEPELPRAQQ